MQIAKAMKKDEIPHKNWSKSINPNISNEQSHMVYESLNILKIELFISKINLLFKLKYFSIMQIAKTMK